MPDGARPYCSHCLEDFDALNRRHHCRCCGSLFCGACSSNFTRLPGFGIEAPARVCERCLAFETEQLPLLLAGDVFIKPGTWRQLQPKRQPPAPALTLALSLAPSPSPQSEPCP